MEVRAISRGVHVSPRKVRLILKRLPGLTVDEALALLRYVPSPHARKQYYPLLQMLKIIFLWISIVCI